MTTTGDNSGGNAGEGMARPLDGVRVVEIAAGRPVAYCAKLLAQSGAEVIRIEPPEGDAIRHLGPFEGDTPSLDGGGVHRLLNAGKRSVTADISTDEGADRTAQLIASADLLITNWRTPSALQLGDPDQIRRRFPSTTYLSISEFGISGPYRDHKADSQLIEALAGNSYVSGNPDREPLSSGIELADYFAAVEGWVAALAALAEATAGARPGFVDISMHEALTMTDDHNLSVYLATGAVRRRHYSRILPGYPSDIFAVKDGYVAFVTAGRGGRNFAGNVSTLIERPELAIDPMFTTVRERLVRWREFDAIVKPWLESHMKHEVFERAGKLELGFGEVPDARGLIDDEHLRIRGYWHPEIDDGGQSTGFLQTGPPAKLSESPLRIGPPAPALSEGNSLIEAAQPRAAEPRSAPAADGRLRFFEQLRVIDLSRGWTGSLTGRVLAELGADVIKVEYARPPISAIGPAYFTVRQASKRSVALDLRSERGREAMLRLLDGADVFVENYPPRVMQEMRLSFADLQERCPRLVMCSIAGFGQDGPNGPRPALGMTMEPASGPASVTGYPGGDPLKTGQTWTDPFAGLHGVGGVIAALLRREVTGRGQHIDVSMQESTIPTMDWHLADYMLNGRIHRPNGNRRPGMVRGAYPCAGDDDWIALSLRTDEEWAAFCRASGHEAWLTDARFADSDARTKHHDDLDRLIGEWTSSRSKGELAEELQAAGVPAAPVLHADEILADPQLAAREFWDWLEVDSLGPVPIERYVPTKFDGRGLAAKSPVPAFGADNVEVLGEVGISEAEVRTLEREQGLVDPWAGIWWHPEVIAARAMEFADYYQIGSVLRIDPDFQERIRQLAPSGE